MGKPTGFKEFQRETPETLPVTVRIGNYVNSMRNGVLKRLASREVDA